ncbi:MAG: hypothetical protein IKQ10_00765 [Oscillospiraceae bacterium]|nr:hypothetical protein [Oscillospiraceae bacterium]
MEYLPRDTIRENRLPGRVVQNAVGHNSALSSERMTVSFCRYSAESGPMAPHNHAEESVVVLDCRDAWVEWGTGPEELTCRQDLRVGDLLHFPPLEWHVFRYGEGGFLDALCIYGQVTNIRPEEIGSSGTKRSE